jgi:hypothetical protein
MEADALSHASDYIDIYSSSWGPDDDGRTVEGPGAQGVPHASAGCSKHGGRSFIFFRLPPIFGAFRNLLAMSF